MSSIESIHKEIAMNVLEFGDDWFLNRAFDADRRMRLLYWMSLARLVVFIAAVGSILGP